MCIKYMSLTNFDLHRLCKKMDFPIVGVFSKDELDPIPHQTLGHILFVLKLFAMKIETITKERKIKRKYAKQSILIVLKFTCRLK